MKKRLLEKLSIIKFKKTIFSFAFLLIFFSIFALGNSVFAVDLTEQISSGIGTAIATILSWIANIFLMLFGWLLTLLIDVLINVANFNTFINASAVTYGWVIVRDLCNMFFILIFLVIAFATILRIESYNSKKLLPKLFIMAVLINFSKTICGLFIDFGQVIMLNFVNAFSNHGGGNFITLFQTDKITSIHIFKENTTGVDSWAIVVSIILGVAALIVTNIVVLVMLAVLIMRIIMLWIYIILSPLAFLLSAFPAGQKYASEWWGDFTKYVITGPVLAFFIWLALTMSAEKIDPAKQVCAGATSFFCSGDFQKYIITIGFLMGGLIITQKLGGVTAGIAGKGIAAIQKGTGWIAKGGIGLIGATPDWINRKQASMTGIDLHPGRQIARIKASFTRSKTKDLSTAELKAGARLKKGGFTGALGGITAMGWGEQHLRGFLAWKGIASAVKGRESWVKGWRRDEKINKWKSKNVFSSEDDWANKHVELQTHQLAAEESGDSVKASKITKDISMLDKYKNDLIAKSPEEADTKRVGFSEKAEKLAKKAANYTVQDYEGQKARKAAIMEEESKIISSNEDELIAQFENAVARNNAPLASALAKSIAKIGGVNALLNKYDYQAASGLTVKEAEIAKTDRTYNNKKGFNDFMRNIFGERLKMDEQSIFTLQSDLGGIGQSIGHSYLTKTVKVNDMGKFEQASEREGAETRLIEDLKRDTESVVRKFNRLEYGAEDKDTGEFKWSNTGLAKAIIYSEIIAKEIAQKRFNTSSAKAFSEKGALNELLQKMEKVGVDKIKFKDSPNGFLTRDEFGELIKDYAKTSSQESRSNLLS